jgi:hypothetical protein
MIYDIEFDRIGRNHAVPPTTAETLLRADRYSDRVTVSRAVASYARPYLASHGFDVEVDLAADLTGTGSIVAGFRTVGTFTVRPRVPQGRPS